MEIKRHGPIISEVSIAQPSLHIKQNRAKIGQLHNDIFKKKFAKIRLDWALKAASRRIFLRLELLIFEICYRKFNVHGFRFFGLVSSSLANSADGGNYPIEVLSVDDRIAIGAFGTLV